MFLRHPIAVAALATALTLSTQAPATTATTADTGGTDALFGVDAFPGGRTYENTLGNFAKWLQEIPAPQNPYVDPQSRRNCAEHGRFVFFAHTSAGPDCVVPAGKLVALSAGLFECSTAEGNGETFRKLRRCARRSFIRVFNRYVFTFTMYVDGQRVEQPRRRRYMSANRIVDLPRENIWGVEGGPTKSSSFGFFYVLEPLPAGRHVIRFVGEDWEFGEFDWRFRFTVE